MKTIEEIKIKLTLKMLGVGIDPYNDIRDLPIDDDLRTFVCSLGPLYSYCYARYIDNKFCDETRAGACKDSEEAYFYAVYVDCCSRPDTREAAHKDPKWKQRYIEEFGE